MCVLNCSGCVLYIHSCVLYCVVIMFVCVVCFVCALLFLCVYVFVLCVRVCMIMCLLGFVTGMLCVFDVWRRLDTLKKKPGHALRPGERG